MMNSRVRFHARRSLLILALLLGGRGFAADQRVVAVGDVHGVYPRFVAILQRVGLINARHQWTGGSTILVQTGDVLDRDPQSRKCLDLLMELEEQAPKKGGRVVPLFGNHEIMNLMGKLRSVSTEEYAAFATPESEHVRQKAYQEYLSFLATSDKSFVESSTKSEKLSATKETEASRKEWMDKHPVGFFEHREAYGPQGRYGRWLRKHEAVVQVGGGIFSHAGLNPRLKFANIKELNDRVRSELAAFDSVWKLLADKKIIWRYMGLPRAVRQMQAMLKAGRTGGRQADPETQKAMETLAGALDWTVMSEEGPLWFRGYGHKKKQQAKLRADLDPMLARLNARYIVMGHSPTRPPRIMNVYDDLVFRIDTGMQLPEGQASALEILDGRFTAYYLKGEPEVLLAGKVR